MRTCSQLSVRCSKRVRTAWAWVVLEDGSDEVWGGMSPGTQQYKSQNGHPIEGAHTYLDVSNGVSV